MKRIYFIILSAILLTSCFDENQYVIKPVDIPVITIPFSMYEYQTYFNLSNSQILSHVSFADWDLGFESSASGYHIILNTSKFMYAGNTRLTNFSAITSNVADSMIYDRSSGNLDSTAIGKWADFSNSLNPIYPKEVYIINRGVNEDGVPLGFKKIVFEKLENNNYFIHFANLDNSDEHYFQIPKNSSVNFVQFSFENGGNLNAQQPDKDLWDLTFTQYSTILFDNNHIPTPYLVRGVLINQGISAVADSITPYASIDINSIGRYIFSTNQDAIGYNWKIYRNNIYSIKDYYTYVIKDRANNYYKLRFTGFYNSIKGDIHYGVKGYPSIELLKLNN